MLFVSGLILGSILGAVWADTPPISVPRSDLDDGSIFPPAGTRIVHPGDKAVMVYVPAGDFIMGIDETEARNIAADLGLKVETLWAWEAYPKRTVHLDGYFIDRCEVTVGQLKQFVDATGTVLKFKESSRHFNEATNQLLPAAEVTWDEAKRYAQWAGKSLPTEAQWEKAARGADGRRYPWGNSPPTAEYGHFGPLFQQTALYVRVGTFPKGASPYGALDMLGNQYEWTTELNLPYPGNPEAEKMKAYAGTCAVLRGGSWYHGKVGFYAAKRFGFLPNETYYHVGFRTVWVPPPEYFQSESFKKDRVP
jgi:formylglycine-generating enzyme required for sulfatase activity